MSTLGSQLYIGRSGFASSVKIVIVRPTLRPGLRDADAMLLGYVNRVGSDRLVSYRI
ncbi:hypothetical protein HOY80DRAFT_1029071 [Tuber brumale]|nr:hypothetical protein HOY80DRAFT_1029071 [Tuber brumale]